MHKVFFDSDVIISSIISSVGASYQLINQKSITPYISSLSYKELLIVTERLRLNKIKLISLIKEKITITKIKLNIKQVKNEFKNYVKDIDDTHIIAGAIESKVKFIISYNLKHFEINKIKEDFKIKIITPGSFLQYLRSIK